MSQSNLPSALTIVLTMAGPPGTGLNKLCCVSLFSHSFSMVMMSIMS